MTTNQNKEGLEALIDQLLNIVAAFDLDRQVDLANAEETGERPNLWPEEVDVPVALLSKAADALSSLREENERLRKEKTEIAMTALAADGQAQEAFVALSASQAQLKIYREALEEVSKGIGSVRWMDPPDGGNVSFGEQVRRMRIDLETAERWRDSMREALTPSGYTKAAYSGEFHERIEVANPMHEGNEDDEPETITQSVPVSWTTIKEIMAKILARSSLSQNQEQSE